MIDLRKVWLPQIIGYAEIVADGTLRRAWQEGDSSQTSVYYSDELYEQVFEDLDADSMRLKMRFELQDQPKVVERVEAFLHSIDRLVSWADTHVDTETWGLGKTIPPNVSAIFRSKEWHETKFQAAQLLLIAEEAGLNSDDFDPS
mgnify:CR=1 FL=1